MGHLHQVLIEGSRILGQKNVGICKADGGLYAILWLEFQKRLSFLRNCAKNLLREHFFAATFDFLHFFVEIMYAICVL